MSVFRRSVASPFRGADFASCFLLSAANPHDETPFRRFINSFPEKVKAGQSPLSLWILETNRLMLSERFGIDADAVTLNDVAAMHPETEEIFGKQFNLTPLQFRYHRTHPEDPFFALPVENLLFFARHIGVHPAHIGFGETLGDNQNLDPRTALPRVLSHTNLFLARHDMNARDKALAQAALRRQDMLFEQGVTPDEKAFLESVFEQSALKETQRVMTGLSRFISKELNGNRLSAEFSRARLYLESYRAESLREAEHRRDEYFKIAEDAFRELDEKTSFVDFLKSVDAYCAAEDIRPEMLTDMALKNIVSNHLLQKFPGFGYELREDGNMRDSHDGNLNDLVAKIENYRAAQRDVDTVSDAFDSAYPPHFRRLTEFLLDAEAFGFRRKASPAASLSAGSSPA